MHRGLPAPSGPTPDDRGRLDESALLDVSPSPSPAADHHHSACYRQAYSCTLGENIYLKDRQRGAAPPDREAAPAGKAQAGPMVPPPPPPPPRVQHTNAKKAMSELNMLADLLGNIAEDVAKEGGPTAGDFKLNLFNDTAIPDGFAAEVCAWTPSS